MRAMSSDCRLWERGIVRCLFGGMVGSRTGCAYRLITLPLAGAAAFDPCEEGADMVDVCRC
jgi:hypothetical protein